MGASNVPRGGWHSRSKLSKESIDLGFVLFGELFVDRRRDLVSEVVCQGVWRIQRIHQLWHTS